MGFNMWADYYPYAAGAPSIGAEALKPDNFEGALGLKYEESMYDPSQDKNLTKDEYLKIVKEDPGRLVITTVPANLEWIKHWVKIPHMTVGSDAMWQNERTYGWDDDFTKMATHPRSSGTHTKVLRLAREEGVPLMFSLNQLSYWNAKHLGDTGLKSMQERGECKKVWSQTSPSSIPPRWPKNLNTRPAKTTIPPVGIPHVIVSGQFVVRDGKAIKNPVGKPIRFPVEEKSRHVPATQEQWFNTYTVDTSPKD